MDWRLLNPLFVDQYVIHAPLAPDECAARIKARMRRWRDVGLGSTSRRARPLKGRLRGSSFDFSRATWWDNGLATHAFGTIQPAEDGSTVEVTLSLTTGSAIMGMLYLGVFTVAVAGGLSQVLNPSTSLFFGLFFGGSYALARWLSRNEGAFVLDVLSRELLAPAIPRDAIGEGESAGRWSWSRANPAVAWWLTSLSQLVPHRNSWLAGSALATIIMAFFWQGSLDFDLHMARDGVQTMAQVTQVDSVNATVQYDYTVDGVTFDGAGPPGPGDPPEAAITVGDEVMIYYLGAAPAESKLGWPQTLVRYDVLAWLGSTLLFAPLLASLVALNTRRFGAHW